jgi:hypothetical protein
MVLLSLRSKWAADQAVRGRIPLFMHLLALGLSRQRKVGRDVTDEQRGRRRRLRVISADGAWAGVLQMRVLGLPG